MSAMPKWLETLIGTYLLSLIVMEWTCLDVMPTPTVWGWLYTALVMAPVTAAPLALLLWAVCAALAPKGRGR
ncbi:hypothetical protein ABTX83_00620 [Streptomyces werraensis]|uniref:hypothetical protein n=1 Tax=Streptomyces werraensis TaxID=68284 RepID=UPI0033207428